MVKMIDFTNCQLSTRNLEYGGRAGEKKGVIYNNEFWFLKFPKNTSGMENVKGLSYVTSPLSEFIGSQIYKILGYDVHETLLGICFDGRRNKVVCACKDFITDDKNELLVPYTSLRNDTNPLVTEQNKDSGLSASNINEVIVQLNHNTVLSQIPNAKQRFWNVVVIDMLINNNDRNEDNWGVIKYKQQQQYKMAPIYDCGGCFYGKHSEERMELILNDPEKLASSALGGITAYEDNKEKRLSNKEILNIRNKDLQNAIIQNAFLVKNKMDEIVEFINSIPNSFGDQEIMSNIRKQYYISTLKIRFEQLLLPAFKKIICSYDKPTSFQELSEKEINTLIDEGLDDIKNGKTKPANEVFDNLYKRFGFSKEGRKEIK